MRAQTTQMLSRSEQYRELLLTDLGLSTAASWTAANRPAEAAKKMSAPRSAHWPSPLDKEDRTVMPAAMLPEGGTTTKMEPTRNRKVRCNARKLHRSPAAS